LLLSFYFFPEDFKSTTLTRGNSNLVPYGTVWSLSLVNRPSVRCGPGTSPRAAMCVRIVNVHVSCSSHGNAQLAAFFIDPRAKGSTEMVCTFLQYFLKPTKHREGARVRQQEKYSIGVLPKKIFGVHKAQKKKVYINLWSRRLDTRHASVYTFFSFGPQRGFKLHNHPSSRLLHHRSGGMG